jgi:hypothetical protein
MFFIPHFQYHIEEWADQKDQILSDLYAFHSRVVECNEGDTMHSSYYEDTDYSEFQPFIDMIAPYLRMMSAEVLEKGYSEKPIDDISRIWFQIQKQYEYHSLHNHGMRGWSAVFYADFNPAVHEATKFYCPIYTVDGELATFQPSVREGDLFIFPAQINHESVVQRSEITRTIISLNLH